MRKEEKKAKFTRLVFGWIYLEIYIFYFKNLIYVKNNIYLHQKIFFLIFKVIVRTLLSLTDWISPLRQNTSLLSKTRLFRIKHSFRMLVPRNNSSYKISSLMFTLSVSYTLCVVQYSLLPLFCPWAYKRALVWNWENYKCPKFSYKPVGLFAGE